MFITLDNTDLDLARESRRQIAREVRENRLGKSPRSAPRWPAWGRSRGTVGSLPRRVAGFLPRSLSRLGARYGLR